VTFTSAEAVLEFLHPYIGRWIEVKGSCDRYTIKIVPASADVQGWALPGFRLTDSYTGVINDWFQTPGMTVDVEIIEPAAAIVSDNRAVTIAEKLAEQYNEASRQLYQAWQAMIQADSKDFSDMSDTEIKHTYYLFPDGSAIDQTWGISSSPDKSEVIAMAEVMDGDSFHELAEDKGVEFVKNIDKATE